MTALRLLLAPLFSAALAGCSITESTSSTETAQLFTPGEASISITSPLPGECIVVPEGPDPRLPILLAMPVSKVDHLPNPYLRPQGYCAVVNTERCGHLVVRVNGVDNNVGASSVVEVLLRKLGDRYADLTIEVKEVGEDGAPLLANGEFGTSKDAGLPLVASVTVKTVETAKECPQN